MVKDLKGYKLMYRNVHNLWLGYIGSGYGYKKGEEKSGDKVNRFCLQLSATDSVFGDRGKIDCFFFLLEVRRHPIRVQTGI